MSVSAKGCPDVLSFMFMAKVPSPRGRTRSYGGTTGLRQILHAAVCSAALVAGAAVAVAHAEAPVRIVALGDSLTAGLGLPVREGFVPRLQAALAAKGVAVEIANAGVSGDTASGGLARLDWSVPEGTDAVILELGANDALRGTDPKLTRSALSDILTRLKARRVAVLLCGMMAPPNYGSDYSARFNAIYPELAKSFGVPLYPFFLEGVAGDAKLNQADGLHPTAEGVDVIVKNILPAVQAFLGAISAQRS